MLSVIPWEVLGEAAAPDGTMLSLTRRGHEYVILAKGKSLMSNRMHGSEEALASIGMKAMPSCAKGAAGKPRVLVGGLGMGYTLRAALNHLPSSGVIDVAELMPAIVDWNRGPLGPLADHPLDDPRAHVVVGDVAETLRKNKRAYDAILLDVDNGPAAFTTDFNGGLYDNAGVANAKAALKPGGTLAVWSAWDDRKFEQRLRYSGFTVSVEHVRARLKQGGPYHTIFIGRLTGANG
jgi:spermidine synthase